MVDQGHLNYERSLPKNKLADLVFRIQIPVDSDLIFFPNDEKVKARVNLV